MGLFSFNVFFYHGKTRFQRIMNSLIMSEKFLSVEPNLMIQLKPNISLIPEKLRLLYELLLLQLIFQVLLVWVYIFILWQKQWATNLYKPLQSSPTMKQISRTICCVKDTLKESPISPKHQHIHANPCSPTCTCESDGVHCLHSPLNPL